MGRLLLEVCEFNAFNWSLVNFFWSVDCAVRVKSRHKVVFGVHKKIFLIKNSKQIFSGKIQKVFLMSILILTSAPPSLCLKNILFLTGTAMGRNIFSLIKKLLLSRRKLPVPSSGVEGSARKKDIVD
jgi:hypothetical protein